MARIRRPRMEHLRAMSSRILRLLAACSLPGAIAAAACGGSSSDHPPSTAGSAGSAAQSGSIGHSGSSNGGHGPQPTAGTAGVPSAPSAKCGGASCKGTVIPLVNIAVPACCADEATKQCGLDTSGLADFGPTFAEPCQALDQPGTPDPACPKSTATMVDLPSGGSFPLQFPGCCRANHTCGYNLDTIVGAVPLGLGCVDASPFLAGEAPQACGETGAAGAGGDSGDGSGAGTGSGVAGAGDEPSTGGIGGGCGGGGFCNLGGTGGTGDSGGSGGSGG